MLKKIICTGLRLKKPKGILLYFDNEFIIDIYNKFSILREYNNIDFFKNEEIYNNKEKFVVDLVKNINIFKIQDLHDLKNKLNSNDTPKIYPNMPICVRGTIKKIQFNKIILEDKDSVKITVQLSLKDKILHEKKFIQDRQIFILGYIDSIQNGITIKCGVILL